MPGAPREPALVLALLLAATLPACFVDPGVSGPTDGDTTALSASTSESTTSTITTSSSTTASTSTSTSTSAAASTAESATSEGATTSPSTTSTTDPTTSTSTSAASDATTSPPATCGDGVVDPGEECDDGNLDDADACLTTCKTATCTDGVKSQDESDVDCGGVCQPCDLCKACQLAEHCASGECFEGLCTRTFSVTIDCVKNCALPGDSSMDVVVGDVPAGTYRATAQPSAGSYWLTQPNPPTKGWLYLAHCNGANFEKMRTPPQIFYATAAEAFANLIAGSEDFAFAGGTFRCGFKDSTCGDNKGAMSFSARRLCP